MCHEDDYYDGDEDRIDFMEPGGRSALRAATKNDPRDQPCPTCESPNRLTRRDITSAIAARIKPSAGGTNGELAR